MVFTHMKNKQESIENKHLRYGTGRQDKFQNNIEEERN
jgi:hypothetical protein